MSMVDVVGGAEGALGPWQASGVDDCLQVSCLRDLLEVVHGELLLLKTCQLSESLICPWQVDRAFVW